MDAIDSLREMLADNAEFGEEPLLLTRAEIAQLAAADIPPVPQWR